MSDVVKRMRSAFPLTMHPSQDPKNIFGGMTLRDYFAGQALAATISNDKIIKVFSAQAENDKREVGDLVASYCYEYADEMLKTRDAGVTPNE